jgi:hypothetical protein
MYKNEIREFIENSTEAVSVNEVISYLMPSDSIKNERSRDVYMRIICRDIDSLVDSELVSYFMVGSIEYLEI